MDHFLIKKITGKTPIGLVGERLENLNCCQLHCSLVVAWNDVDDILYMMSFRFFSSCIVIPTLAAKLLILIRKNHFQGCSMLIGDVS